MKKLLSVLAAGAASVASAVMVTGDGNAQMTYLQDKTVITVTQSGKLYVTEPGEIELLVVGGGGGGGQGVENGGWSPGAGGGGGGVIHKETFSVSAGPYDVVIGAGGAVNTGSRPLGGDTTVFGLTAKGGGCGAKGAAFTLGADGASGGGGTKGWSSTMAASKAIYGSYGNLGHDGGEGAGFYTSGGGGGAGTAANGATGGEGYPCSITGTEVYYAGGGKAPAGKGSAADNCYGGGGAGDKAGYAGVVIVSFVRSAKPCSEDFSLSGWNRRYLNENDTAVAFTESGVPLTLTVTGEGSVDVLLVGGGGGGGKDNSSEYCGAGGGAGGVIYLKNMPVTAGTYDITVGTGGAVSVNGGDSTAFGLTAYGGGHGANASSSAGSGGGCGGGATTYYQGPKAFGGGAQYAAKGNIGFKGGDTSDYFKPAGGGGAGGPGGDGDGTAHGGVGGIGYLCNITGEELYYAGGGGGAYWGGAAGGLGGGGAGGTKGTDGLGGGGGANAAGGSGVVILRYAKKSYEACFDDATGGKMSSFTRDGKRYRVHTFASDGQFVLSHPAKVEVLLVGGGGGGGGLAGVTQYARGGGGGGGGVIHKSLILEAKPYDISIGEGGAVNGGARPNGGNTVAFGLTAYGGGCGAKSEGFTLGTDGASGGGGSKGSSTQSARKAIYCDAPCFNLGHDGAEASNIYNSGGGGGAGAAANGTVGGDGYPCSITGKEVYYAGGGGGNGANGAGGGKDCYGGGGKSNEVGGKGVVIVCHEKPRTGLILVVE